MNRLRLSILLALSLGCAGEMMGPEMDPDLNPDLDLATDVEVAVDVSSEPRADGEAEPDPAPAEIEPRACAVPTEFASIQAAVDEPTCTVAVLAEGVYEENVLVERPFEIQGASAELVTIDGGGNGAAVSSRREPLIVSGVTIRNGAQYGIVASGDLTIRESIITENQGTGIEARRDLSVVDCVISHNDASDRRGGGIYYASREGSSARIEGTEIFGNVSQQGGGIAARNPVTIVGSYIHDNEAVIEGYSGDGGGVHAGDGLTMIGTLVEANRADSGGGVAASGEVTLERVLIQDNEGGGLRAHGDVAVDRTTIRNNTHRGAWFTGNVIVRRSAIVDNSEAFGRGGVLAGSGHIIFENVTVSGNEGARGAGIRIEGNSELRVELTNTTVTNNTADRAGGIYMLVRDGEVAELMVRNTIVSGNHAEESADCEGIVRGEGTNIIGSDEGCFLLGSDMRVRSVVLGELVSVVGEPEINGNADFDHVDLNGTWIHPLTPDSLATRAGGSPCLDHEGQRVTVDQAGQPRSELLCDLGASASPLR